MAESSVHESSMLKKFTRYLESDGFAYTLFAGVGRKYGQVWRLAGPFLARSAWKHYRTANEKWALNLGSGSNRIEGMFNVDVDPRAQAYVDVTRPLIFPDNCFTAIFCEEVLEHVDEHYGRQLLTECWRVLEPGGTVRFTTPDLAYFCKTALDVDPTGAVTNGIFYGHGHRKIYTRQLLRSYLVHAGFSQISFSSYQSKDSKLGRHDSHAHRFGHPPEISLYVEAVKPTA